MIVESMMSLTGLVVFVIILYIALVALFEPPQE
jgi:hypothetical protein